MPSSQKSIFIARLGNVAGLTLAEEAKPIARNKCIESVAQWMRQNAEAGSKGPWQAQALRHANAALRFEPGDALRDQNVGLVVFRIETIVDVERAAERRLGAQQPILPVAVVAQDELGPAGTKRAVTVEDDDRSIVTEFWNGRIPAIAVGLAYSADRHDSITPPPSPAPPFASRPAAA